jgi:hypothetical protein
MPVGVFPGNESLTKSVAVPVSGRLQSLFILVNQIYEQKPVYNGWAACPSFSALMAVSMASYCGFDVA